MITKAVIFAHYFLFSCGIILTDQQQQTTINKARTFRLYAQGQLTNPEKIVVIRSVRFCAALCINSGLCSGYSVNDLDDGTIICSIAGDDLTWTNSTTSARIYTGIYNKRVLNDIKIAS
jgi:hypothetical protein